MKRNELNDVAQRWRHVLEDKARVYTKDEAIAAGLYGPVRDRSSVYRWMLLLWRPSNVTIVDSRTQSDVSDAFLPAVHGS